MPGAGEPLISLDASSRYFIILSSCPPASQFWRFMDEIITTSSCRQPGFCGEDVKDYPPAMVWLHLRGLPSASSANSKMRTSMSMGSGISGFCCIYPGSKILVSLDRLKSGKKCDICIMIPSLYVVTFFSSLMPSREFSG